jgi:DUF4097 and DUF4098 domain-containing protein YvlB
MRFSLLALTAVLLTGCDMDDVASWTSNDRFKEDFRMSYPLKSGASLSIENLNGSIEIISWEKDTVDVNGTKYAATEDTLKRMKIEAEQTETGLRLRTARPDTTRCNCGAKYILRVPKRLRLEGINTSNGSIRVEDIEGDARLVSSNGSVRITRLRGRLDAKTSNASVELRTVTGDVVVRTSNGAIRADGIEGSLDADTSNASITARIEKLAPGKPLKLESSNGSIDLSLPDYKDQAIDADTSNSSITLRLPAVWNGELRASTSNANVTSDFEVGGSTSSKNRLEGRVGQGGQTIRLNTSNGSIRVQRL